MIYIYLFCLFTEAIKIQWYHNAMSKVKKIYCQNNSRYRKCIVLWTRTINLYVLNANFVKVYNNWVHKNKSKGTKEQIKLYKLYSLKLYEERCNVSHAFQSNIFHCLRQQHGFVSGTLHFGHMRSTQITYS